VERFTGYFGNEMDEEKNYKLYNKEGLIYDLGIYWIYWPVNRFIYFY
jgi:hypothetical protein